MQKIEKKTEKLKYKKLIVVISILIPVVVAILFRIRLENVDELLFLPPIYATINGFTAIVLLFALWAIKNKKMNLHQNLMKIAILLSVVFLVMYVAYHLTSDPTPFGGEAPIKYIYYFILISHILLSIGIIPLVLISYARAISKQFQSHKRIARITFPIWLYITVTGVIIYVMISPYYWIMKKFLIIFFLILNFRKVYSQCSMCRAVLESEDALETAKGINDGIVYLMTIPYILVGLVGFFVYKQLRK